MDSTNNARGQMSAIAQLIRGAGLVEAARAPRFTFNCELYDAEGRLKDSWVDRNIVTTEGLNKLLAVMFDGDTQVTAWYLGLISSVSWSAVAATDTAAQINGSNGWKEAGPSNAPDYTYGSPDSARGGPIPFGTASAASLPSTGTIDYIFTGPGTLKGAFVATNGTRNNTTGTLYAAAAFTGGDKTVAGGDTLKVSVTVSFTST